MTDFDRLLAAIRANPGEDAPRLVLADWLAGAGRELEAIMQRIIAEPDRDEWRLDYAAELERTAGRVDCRVCGGKGYRFPGQVLPAGGFDASCSDCFGTGRVSDGRAELAAFVRVQCELAARDDERCRCRECQPTGQHTNGPCRSPLKPLRRRERELWPAVRGAFEGEGWEVICENAVRNIPLEHVRLGYAIQEHNPLLIVRRGLPAVVRCTLAEWMGGECGQCQGRGHRTLYGDGSGPWAKCQYCIDGHAPGIGPPLAQRWPIVAVETDVAIHKSGGNDTYYVGGLGMFPQKYWRQLEGHRTPSAARAALSAALIAEARGQSVDGGI